MSRRLTCAMAVWLMGMIAPEFAGAANTHDRIDCLESDHAALSWPCRPTTLAKVDEQVMLPLQSILKYEVAKYRDDDEYAKWMDYAFEVFADRLVEDVEVSDPYNVMFPDYLAAKNVDSYTLLDRFSAFPVEHAGCNLTTELAGNVRMARGTVIAYQKDGVQKFATIYAQFIDPRLVHAQRRSERTPSIVNIDVVPLVPGTENSNLFLTRHILPDPSENCERIIRLMDPAIIDELRR